MAPHSSTLAWKIPWMEEPDRLQSMGSRRVGHDWGTSLSLFTFLHWRRKWQRTPVFLPGESQGRGSLVAAIYGVTLKWLSSSSSRLEKLSDKGQWASVTVFPEKMSQINHCQRTERVETATRSLGTLASFNWFPPQPPCPQSPASDLSGTVFFIQKGNLTTVYIVF